MDREHPQGEPFLDEDHLVPDYLPAELLTDHEEAARATVASKATTRAGRRTARPGRRRPTAGRPRTRTNRRQRLHTILGMALGYLGTAAMTAWWWSLAQTRPQPVWQWVTVLGAALLAIGTVAILVWLALGVRARWRRSRRDHGKQAPVDAGSLA